MSASGVMTWDFVENMDFARSVVRRKKSVRRPPDASGMGSEIVGLYMDELVELRELGLRCRPLQMTHASIKKAPMNMPGKKPARKTPTGNLLHVDSVCEAEELRPVVREVDVAAVLVDVAVLVTVEDVLDEVEDEVEVALVLPTMVVFAISWQTGDEDVA